MSSVTYFRFKLDLSLRAVFAKQSPTGKDPLRLTRRERIVSISAWVPCFHHRATQSISSPGNTAASPPPRSPPGGRTHAGGRHLPPVAAAVCPARCAAPHQACSAPTCSDWPKTCTSRMIAAPPDRPSRSGESSAPATTGAESPPAGPARSQRTENAPLRHPPCTPGHPTAALLVDPLLAHLPAADTAACRPPPRQFALNIQSQAGALVPRHHIVRRNIAYHPVDPAVRLGSLA